MTVRPAAPAEQALPSPLTDAERPVGRTTLPDGRVVGVYARADEARTDAAETPVSAMQLMNLAAMDAGDLAILRNVLLGHPGEAPLMAAVEQELTSRGFTWSDDKAVPAAGRGAADGGDR